MTDHIFLELSIIVIVTVVIAGLAKILKQPLIIAYIIAGLLLSPSALNVVTAHEAIGTFSQLGIAFLLFMVGMGLNPKVVKSVGKISVLTGIGQIIFTCGIGFLIASFLNFNVVESLYIAIAMTFSSTIVIMKLLSDKKDLNTLYGKISMGFLIVQDIVAMVILLLVSSATTEASFSTIIIESIVKTLGSIAVVLLIGKYLISKILQRMADSPELLMLFCIAWCFGLASAFHAIGLTIEIGALLAGVTLSLSPYRHEIFARIRPLRDFFLLMFFVFLGTQMQFDNFQSYIVPTLIFSAFILIGNPIIVMILMGASRYTKKTSFLAGLTVAQISEFSIILIALGIKMGHIGSDILSFVTITGLITIGGSTYFIIHGKKLYKKLAKYLTVFERSGKKVDENKSYNKRRYDAVLLGYNRIGINLSTTLKKLHKHFLVVDYNPEIIDTLIETKIPCLYSDVEDENLFEEIDFKKVKLVVSAIKNPDINFHVIEAIQEINKNCIIIVVSERVEEALECYKKGATYVIMPHNLGGHHLSTLIEHIGLNSSKFSLQKIKHLEQLQTA